MCEECLIVVQYPHPTIVDSPLNGFQHNVRILMISGRCGMIVPESVLLLWHLEEQIPGGHFTFWTMCGLSTKHSGTMQYHQFVSHKIPKWSAV